MTADFTALLETSWAPSAAELPSGTPRLIDRGMNKVDEPSDDDGPSNDAIRSRRYYARNREKVLERRRLAYEDEHA